MYYTLKDMVRLSGLNERTVPKMLERYTQRTGTVRAEMAKDGRHWRYSEQDLEWVLAEKQHEAEERTRKAPAPYTHDTDAPAISELVARLDAIEAQLATLRERASWLFAPVARSEGQQTALDVLDVSSISHPPVRRPRASYVPPASSSSSDGEWPASANGRGKWVARHGGPGTSWARTFDDVKEWSGPEDAIAAVRRHQRWHDWQPIECADPSCQCHELLGVAARADTAELG